MRRGKVAAADKSDTLNYPALPRNGAAVWYFRRACKKQRAFCVVENSALYQLFIAKIEIICVRRGGVG
jgi:hypothetical protein